MIQPTTEASGPATDPRLAQPTIEASGPATDPRLVRALELGYAYLNRRDRTVREVRRHLEQKGIAPEPLDAAIQRLADQGYLNDSRFARVFAADKRELEQWGSERIRSRLLARGIDRELVQAALLDEPAGAVSPELNRAVEVLRRRFARAPRDGRERERALGVLIRKGYDCELALDALSALARAE